MAVDQAPRLVGLLACRLSGAALLDVVSVVVACFFGFVVLPWIVLPRPRSGRNLLDRVVINFLRWMALVIVLTEALAAMRLYERSTLIALCLIGFWLTKLRPRGWTLRRVGDSLHQLAFGLTGLLERREWVSWVPWEGAQTAASQSRTAATSSVATVPEGHPAGSEPDPSGVGTLVTPAPPPRRRRRRPDRRSTLASAAMTTPILVVLGWSSYLRFQLPLANAALTPGDDYVHMTWAAQLGTNQLMPNGIYPMGMATVLAYVSKLDPVADLPEVTRYVGPLIGTTMVLGLFYVALRMSRSPGAALLAAGTFGLFGSRLAWYEPWSRQIGALPQELCLDMSLFALVIVALAVLTEDRDHLWTLAAAGIAMSMTHPLPVVFYLGMAPGVAFVIGIVTGHIRTAIRVSVVAVGAAILGFGYIPIAYAVGVPFYAGIGGLNPFSSSGTPGAVTYTFAAANVKYGPMTYWAMAFAAAGVIGSLVLLSRQETRVRGTMLLGLSAMSVALLIAYDPTFLGLSNFYAQRTANIAGPQIALSFGAGVGALAVFFRRIDLRAAGASLACGVGCLAVFGVNFPPQPRPFQPIEYDSEGTVAQQIIDHTTALTYTIVGLPEQRQRAEGLSHFVELWVFARDVRLSEAEDPSYELPIPTTTTYLFTEKIPFPQQKLAPLGATEEYYRNPVKRARIETISYQWAQTYMRFHTDMSVYYDDKYIRVYVLHEIPDSEASNQSPQFKSYVWHPGVLFNHGPTNPLKVPIP